MADHPSEIFSLGRADLRRAAATLKRWRKLPSAGVDHKAVMAHLMEEGGISARYCVLTMLSCGIAILGLLLSSAAVVIGAMLISPLMSPIILFGFSLATLDTKLMIRSLKAIALGTALAVSQAAVIVWLSPLNAVTPEILARTQPNFFDLLVAIFSAIAGAYAVASRKGETIVGVAIATALMPPLAVIGYGLAVANWVIFAGAGGLFMTNLLAIGLTASLVAKFFGFGSSHEAHVGMWQTAGIFAVFAVLSIPLGLSLRQLASEALLTSRIRATLDATFAPDGGHLYGVNIAFPSGQPIAVEALVLTQKVRADIESGVEKKLATAVGSPVQLTLSQIPVHPRESMDRQAVEQLVSQSSATLTKQIEAERQPDMAAIASAEAGVPPLGISADDTARSVVVRSPDASAARLASLRAAAGRLRARYPGWNFTFRPDLSALPVLSFAAGRTDLDAPNRALLDNIVWALKENGIQAVRVTGMSDSGGSASANRKAALARARAVADILNEAGIAATPVSGYPVPNQITREREEGRAPFRAARIEPVNP